MQMLQQKGTMEQETEASLLELNYSGCKYSCELERKKFFGYGTRYIYIFLDKIAICKKPFKPIPERIIKYKNEVRVQWFYIKNDKCILKGISIQTEGKSYHYSGNDISLRGLKTHIAPFLIQKKVQDEYKPQNILGKGSFAMVQLISKFQVLEIKNLFNNEIYAGKCIDKAKLQNDERNLKSLYCEIDVMRQLSLVRHPSILQLREVYEGENSIYLIMDLAKGNTLNAFYKSKQGLITLEETRIIMKQLLEGIQSLHSLDIMHRDIKPDNIIFLERGNINSLRIVDFGLAINYKSSPYLYPKCGTPGYIAPEVLNLSSKYSGQYRVSCDIFSCGVILYVLLSGEKPFKSNNKEELIALNKDCKINWKKIQNCNIFAKDLVQKMLEINPEKRISANNAIQHPFLEDEKLDQFSSILYICEEEVDSAKIINMNKLKRSSMELQNSFVQHKSSIHSFKEQNMFSIKELDLMSPFSCTNMVEELDKLGSFKNYDLEIEKKS